MERIPRNAVFRPQGPAVARMDFFNGLLTVRRPEFQRQLADAAHSLLDGRIPTSYLNMIVGPREWIAH